MRITREPGTASRRRYDVIVVGGGVYGAMLALEGSLRGLSVLVLEKEDFGGGTSYNSLRIIHGGLRELQSLNLGRYWEFGGERRWYLDSFPELAERLPVLVPLYQQGLLRTGLFRLAFGLDRLLLPRRDREVEGERVVPSGRVLSPDEVQRLFPAVDERGLRGGVLWYDAAVPDSQRLIVEVLRWACGEEAVALNYMPAVDLLTDRNRVAGVRARDAVDGTHHEFGAEVVVNAAGPWSREIARHFDRDVPDLYRPSMAWNVLFDREAPSACALGVTPPAPEGRMYFVHPWKGRLLAGTGHAPRSDRDEAPRPSRDEVDGFLKGLNEAVPEWELRRRDILHIYAGYLPVEKKRTTRLVRKDRWIDHGRRGGPEGLFSVRSTKFTAARSTAEKVISEVFPDRGVSDERRDAFRRTRAGKSGARGVFDYHWEPGPEEASWREELSRIIDEESVVHLDDLVLRRTSLGDDPVRALQLSPRLCDLFGWEEDRCEEEIRRVEDHFRWVRRPE